MIRFDAAPAIPANYQRLRVLTLGEIDQARSFAYIADTEDPSASIGREGVDYSLVFPDYDITDWRIRIYIVWFCYIYENYNIIQSPDGAIYELILEFKAPDIVDISGRRLGTLYAGAGYQPLTEYERKREIELLKPHYEKALRLLEQYIRGNLEYNEKIEPQDSIFPIAIMPSSTPENATTNKRVVVVDKAKEQNKKG